MSDADDMHVSELALHLGVAAGALSRPAVAEKLVLLLRQPDAAGFSLPAVTELHARLGEVLAAVTKPSE